MEVLHTGFCQLVLEPGAKPETFRMDWERLSKMGGLVKVLVSAASMLVVLAADTARLLKIWADSSSRPDMGANDIKEEVDGLLKSVGGQIDDFTSTEVLSFLSLQIIVFEKNVVIELK